MAFRPKKKASGSYASIESMFRDFRNRKVEGPLSHQSDILRRYEQEAFNEPNVAFELPTGSGKTLIGLLIAEFRRVTKNERVLYLCPTKQLVLQVCEQAERKYGLKATAFLGKIKEYDPDDRVKYLTNKTVAVATYSALFNTNPFFDSPELIVLDDAHASENYIASAWSLDVVRKDFQAIYHGLLNILKPFLPLEQFRRFQAAERDERGVKWIEKIPTSKLLTLISTISEFLDVNTPETNLQYSWSLLHGHLEACQVYVSYDNILIRPLIPPSLNHLPFSNARQRVFMSATLGLGGDLERMTGIRSFFRLPMPAGWDKQGLGRRFFVFPELSLKDDKIRPILKQMISTAGRGLLLVPSEPQAKEYKEAFSEFKVFGARDIESSKDEFVRSTNAVAVLAGRYDGIDMLGDDCRLLIVDGLPKAGNLQELFLISRLACGILFNDRIRTRIIQAVGRCTRSATDYAAVCVIGEDFNDWLVINEKRALFHPELQGELKFGIEQSTGLTMKGVLENLRVFLEHGDQWDEVDGDIREYRDESVQATVPGQEFLLQAAPLEVDYVYAMWRQDFARAVELCQQIGALLAGDDFDSSTGLKGLRGLWNYLAGAACELTAAQTGESAFSSKAAEMYDRAAVCVPMAGWLKSLRTRKDATTETKPDRLLESNVERMEMLFESRSYSSPRRFEKDVKLIADGLASENDAEAFEEAHRQLGELLGFESGNSNSDAAPDPWWVSNDELCIVSEDKNDSDPKNSVPIKHTRQAASHAKWIKVHVPSAAKADIYTVMITPQKSIHPEVPTYADDVHWWDIDEFRKWASTAIAELRKLQATFTGPGNVEWRKFVYKTLRETRLDPSSIVITATQHKLKDCPVKR